MPKENNNRRKKILLFGGAFLLLFLLGLEAYFRFSFPENRLAQIFEPDPNPKLLYRLKPGAAIMFDGTWGKLPSTEIKISAYGLRDRDYPLVKGEASRILVLGDSFTFGWGVDLGDTFVKQLETILNREGGGRDYQVINLGAPAYNTRQEVEFFKEKGLPLDPDLVLVGFMCNDFDRLRNLFYFSDLFRPLYGHSYLLRVLHILYLMGWEHYQARFYHEKNGWKEVSQALAELKEIGTREGFAVSLILFTDGRAVTRRLRNFCRARGIPLLDLTYLRKKELMLEGDLHPNAQGHLDYAEDIYRFLRREGLISKAGFAADSAWRKS